MSKRISYKVLGSIRCSCGSLAEKRTHKEITEKILNQPYYFGEYTMLTSNTKRVYLPHEITFIWKI